MLDFPRQRLLVTEHRTRRFETLCLFVWADNRYKHSVSNMCVRVVVCP